MFAGTFEAVDVSVVVVVGDKCEAQAAFDDLVPSDYILTCDEFGISWWVLGGVDGLGGYF